MCQNITCTYKSYNLLQIIKTQTILIEVMFVFLYFRNNKFIFIKKNIEHT